jgi:hypothetical protein
MLHINKKKWENFWYYYKIHVFVAVFIGFFTAITIKDCAERIEPDVTIAYIGADLQSHDIAQLEQEFAGVIQDINNDDKKHVYILPVTDERKLFVMIAAREAQILILERTLFEQYAQEGGLQPLDELIETFQFDVGKHPEIQLIPKEEQEKHVYGIPLEGNSLFENLGLVTKEKYVSMLSSENESDTKKITVYTNAYAIMEELRKHYRID